ncbi:MAG: hypothetical protein M1828_004228 [Chrysothrix sp. TS-e1954]|nr:MAG: hypothetical protein M1828_004228 [Chrysothrix sp. TS-e1954]
MERRSKRRFVDVGVNLTDPCFRGEYRGKQRHDDDLTEVMKRAQQAGCERLLITGSDPSESRKAVTLAQMHPGLCFATVGIHPCSSSIFDNSGHEALSELESLIDNAKSASGSPVRAFGEIGLDYDRLHYCSKELQVKSFELQLDLAVRLTQHLPLFLHSRAAHRDFVTLLQPRLKQLPPRCGLVHSFTGSLEEMQELVGLGLDIGVNGCSLKAEENLKVVRAIPLDHLQLETDAPWCEMRQSHAGRQLLESEDAQKSDEEPLPFYKEKMFAAEKWQEGSLVKGRNEPCMIGIVARIVARVKGIPETEVTEAAWHNSTRMFDLDISSSGATACA